MRFSLIATIAATSLAAPFAIVAGGPQMSSEEFLSEVRCVAYADVSHANADLGANKFRLNAEAERQEPEVARQAIEEVEAIARLAAAGDLGAAREVCATSMQARALGAESV